MPAPARDGRSACASGVDGFRSCRACSSASFDFYRISRGGTLAKCNLVAFNNSANYLKAEPEPCQYPAAKYCCKLVATRCKIYLLGSNLPVAEPSCPYLRPKLLDFSSLN